MRILKTQIIIALCSVLTVFCLGAQMVSAADACAGLTGNSLKTCRASESSSGSQAGSTSDFSSSESQSGPINPCSDSQKRSDAPPTKCATQQYQCGAGTDGSGKSLGVKTSFNFGCIGGKLPQSQQLNPLLDMFYALTRFITDGVGIILVIMVIVAGIRYTTSTGDPQKTEAAIKLVRGAIIGLLVYIFAAALIQWLVPGGVFNNVI